jgi:uroporphyrinogen-III synthase
LRLWISRSQPGAERQAEDLIAAGHEVLVEPVIGVEPVDEPLPRGDFQTVIFLSEHAVRHAERLDFCDGAEVYTVGERTGRALAGYNIEVHVAREASSEGLLESVASASGIKVLIVAGLGGRKRVRDELLKRGADVSEYLCYRRVPLQVDLTEHAAIDAILVSSQDGFRHVARLWFEFHGRADVQVLVASQRIGEIGVGLGFCNVTVASGAASEDWIEVLSNVCGGR